MKPVLYIDMDGVTANFEGKAFELFGDKWRTEINSPGWGRFKEYPNLYEILDPYPKARELYERCCELMGDKNQVRALTALPSRAKNYFPDAARDKILWNQRHISKDFRTYFGPLAKDKQHHVMTSRDILIDDMERNIEQWNAKGAIGILHRSIDETLEILNTLIP